jgi:hypothetical protein
MDIVKINISLCLSQVDIFYIFEPKYMHLKESILSIKMDFSSARNKRLLPILTVYDKLHCNSRDVCGRSREWRVI